MLQTTLYSKRKNKINLMLTETLKLELTSVLLVTKKNNKTTQRYQKRPCWNTLYSSKREEIQYYQKEVQRSVPFHKKGFFFSPCISFAFWAPLPPNHQTIPSFQKITPMDNPSITNSLRMPKKQRLGKHSIWKYSIFVPLGLKEQSWRVLSSLEQNLHKHAAIAK